ncbi:CDP-diacylglycerol--glycerol-3-phosphate 3-phosphatidyltransferase [Mycoplasmoides pirum]|uniref:CDP-diacylglycerol--glycerol-3-phosphate 3-phosphatidyltransferase n=1 Tax=Mycoplasmoides pirum TaxID=2122 RepID=UPI0006975968|nr:CDP-diacylglycerol--glycerol-3-phosphate 3-phosphatidyltransferase [Mycoplasmoides pirum]
MKKTNIPNLLTIFRIILFVPIILLISLQTNIFYEFNFLFINSQISLKISIGFFVAGILFIISSISDWLDGYLARKWNVISDWGKMWDPIADKILINSLLIAFAAQGIVHFSLVIIFIVRDILMDGFRMFALNKNIIISANIFGKLKTIFQMLSCILSLFFFTFSINNNLNIDKQLWFWLIQMLPYWIAILFSIISCWIYFKKVTKLINSKNTTK